MGRRRSESKLTISRTLIRLLLITLFVSAPARGASRVAIIATGAGESLKNIAAVAEAELSASGDFNLLERQQIDNVLAEQKLSLAGMIDATSAIQVGKILATDLLVLIEGEPNSPQFGLVIFDPGTGVQLWNAAATSANGEAAAAEIVKAIKASAVKRTDVAHRKTVCIMAVRNGDLSRQFDSLCDAVGRLTERGMVSSPAVAMLERTRLDQVTRERALVGDATARTLLASLVIVDLEIDRGTTASGLKATALLSDSASRSIGKVSVESRGEDAAALANALVTSLSVNLKTPATAPLDNLAEAARFCNEALFRISNSDFAHAVAPAEAAHALTPGNLMYRAVLAHCLIDAGWQQFRIPPGGFNHGRGGWEDHSVAPASVLRGAQMLEENQRRPVPADARTARLSRDHFLDALATLRSFVSQANFFNRDSHEPLTTTDVPTLRGDLRRILLSENESRSALPRDQATFDDYSDFVTQLLGENYRLFSNNSDQWAQDVQTIVELWHSAKARLNAACRSREMGVVETSAMGWQFKDFGPNGFSSGERRPLWAIGPNERQSLQRVRKLIAENSDPIIRRYAALMDLSFTLCGHDPTPEEIKTAVESFIARRTADLAAANSPAARQSDYRMMAIADALLDHTGYEGVYSEQLARTMLDHHDLLPTLIYRAKRRRPNEEEGPANARRQRVLESALAVLQLADCSLPDGATIASEKRSIEEALRVTGWGVNETAKSTPPPPANNLNWYGCRRLLDLAEVTTATQCIYEPRADGAFVYALAAIDPGDQQPFQMQLLKLPLAGGEPTRLGSLPTTYTDRVNNPQGRGGLLCQLASASTLGDGFYAATVSGSGVYVYPIDGGEPILLDDSTGFPARNATAVAILDGVIYAGLGVKNKEAYIAAYDLSKKHVDVLASSVRKDRQSPFDDGPAFDVINLLPDAPRKRLIVAAVRRGETTSKVTGLWEYKPATRVWRQLLAITLWMQRSEDRNGASYTMLDFVRSAGPDRLLARVSTGLFLFDLKLDQPRKIHLDETVYPAIPRETPRLPGVGEAFGTSLDSLIRSASGWRAIGLSNLSEATLWTSIGRISLVDGSVQSFDNPRPQSRTGITIVEPLPDGRVLIGDSWGLVLADARPNHPPAREKLTPFPSTH